MDAFLSQIHPLHPAKVCKLKVTQARTFVAGRGWGTEGAAVRHVLINFDFFTTTLLPGWPVIAVVVQSHHVMAKHYVVAEARSRDHSFE